MVFQDPYASLNPRLRVGSAISEAPLANGLIKAHEREAWLAQLLQKVDLDGLSGSVCLAQSTTARRLGDQRSTTGEWIDQGSRAGGLARTVVAEGGSRWSFRIRMPRSIHDCASARRSAKHHWRMD